MLTQTYSNIEVLIIDDCSTDQSREIIQKYLEKNASIHYVCNEKNLGLVGNWNKCIELATGEWVKFVFQDDTIVENCIESFVNCSQKSPVSLLVSKRSYLTRNLSAKQEMYYNRKLPTIERMNINPCFDAIRIRNSRSQI